MSEVIKNLNVTYSKGINVSGTIGIFTYDYSIGIALDAKGNVGLQHSFASGVTASATPSIAVSEYKSVTNAPDIYTLEGDGGSIGGAAAVTVEGVPIYGSADLNIVGNVNNNINDNYYGVTVATGVGTPGAEMHAEISTTNTIVAGNIFNIGKN